MLQILGLTDTNHAHASRPALTNRTDMAIFTIQSASGEETVSLGQSLGKILREGDMVALVGELGSGKTCFTKGIARGLGVPPEVVVTSPSFSLVNEYEAGGMILHHMDIYRLENRGEFMSAGLEEVLFGDGVAVMEWADRWPEVLPEYSIMVEFTILDDRSRNITFSGQHPRAEEIIEQFMKGMKKG